jgi:hypothetical protein
MDCASRFCAKSCGHGSALMPPSGRSEDEGAWLKKPHDAPVFGGQSPMNLVTNGTQDGLMLVRHYLDA